MKDKWKESYVLEVECCNNGTDHRCNPVCRYMREGDLLLDNRHSDRRCRDKDLDIYSEYKRD